MAKDALAQIPYISNFFYKLVLLLLLPRLIICCCYHFFMCCSIVQKHLLLCFVAKIIHWEYNLLWPMNDCLMAIQFLLKQVWQPVYICGLPVMLVGGSGAIYPFPYVEMPIAICSPAPHQIAGQQALINVISHFSALAVYISLIS